MNIVHFKFFLLRISKLVFRYTLNVMRMSNDWGNYRLKNHTGLQRLSKAFEFFADITTTNSSVAIHTSHKLPSLSLATHPNHQTVAITTEDGDLFKEL